MMASNFTLKGNFSIVLPIKSNVLSFMISIGTPVARNV